MAPYKLTIVIYYCVCLRYRNNASRRRFTDEEDSEDIVHELCRLIDN